MIYLLDFNESTKLSRIAFWSLFQKLSDLVLIPDNFQCRTTGQSSLSLSGGQTHPHASPDTLYISSLIRYPAESVSHFFLMIPVSAGLCVGGCLMKPQYETRFGGLHVIMLLLAYFFLRKRQEFSSKTHCCSI